MTDVENLMYRRAAEADVVGWVETLNARQISGWVWRRDMPQRRLDVEVVVEGVPVHRVSANRFRKDLEAAGIGDGSHSFAVLFPPGTSIRRESQVTVRVVDTGAELPWFEPAVPDGAAPTPEITTKLGIMSDHPPEMRAGAWDFDSPTEKPSEVEPWGRLADDVLIIGSAHTVEEHEAQVRAFRGEIWALNDAVFWLNKKKVHVDRLFVTDSRFVMKKRDTLSQAQFGQIVTIDTVDWAPTDVSKDRITTLHSLGRDGFSRNFGAVFHGCSVVFTALQCAAALHYSAVTTCGVILSPPITYKRIDGTQSLPEYVHNVQISNARRAMKHLREAKITFESLESASNLNFL